MDCGLQSVFVVSLCLPLSLPSALCFPRGIAQVPSDDQPTQEVPLVCDEDERNSTTTTTTEALPSYGEAATGKAPSQHPAVYMLPSYEEVQDMKRQHVSELRRKKESGKYDSMGKRRGKGKRGVYVRTCVFIARPPG